MCWVAGPGVGGMPMCSLLCSLLARGCVEVHGREGSWFWPMLHHVAGQLHSQGWTKHGNESGKEAVNLIPSPWLPCHSGLRTSLTTLTTPTATSSSSPLLASRTLSGGRCPTRSQPAKRPASSCAWSPVSIPHAHARPGMHACISGCWAGFEWMGFRQQRQQRRKNALLRKGVVPSPSLTHAVQPRPCALAWPLRPYAHCAHAPMHPCARR